MKKKLFSLIALCFIFITCFTLSGCGAITLQGGPSVSDVVTGNSGLSVRKGDYLYFVNGYVSNKNLKGSDNNYGVAKNGAIYRAKLENGKLMYDITTDEDENEIKTLKNVELLVPMIAGFEYSSLYIFEDYLYFTSPNTEKDNTGKIRFDLTDIFVVSLNGGKPAKIANALNVTSKDNIIISAFDNNVYVTYLVDSKLNNIKLNGSSVESRTIISEKATSFAIDEENIYYTRNFIEGENNITGNVLAKADKKTNTETIISKDNYNTYSIKQISNGKIFYTRTNSLTTNAYIYSNMCEDFNENNEKQYTVVAYASNQNIFDLGAGYTTGVIVSENNKLLYLTGINDLDEDIINLYDGAFTVLGIYGEYVYGKDADNNIVRVNIQTKALENLVSKEAEVNFDMAVNFDYEGGYIYYYVKSTGKDDSVGYYLNRTYINQAEKESELVGVVLDKHLKVEAE